MVFPDRVDLGEPDWQATLYQLARYKFIRELFQPNDVVLDVGCGYGYPSILLAERIKKVYALDSNADVYKTNIEKYSHQGIVYIDNDYKNYKPSIKFDGIISVHFIEHLDKSEGKNFIEWSIQNLKSDGLFILSTPKYLPFEKRTPNRKKHENEFTYTNLRDLLQQYFGRVIIFSQTDEYIGFFYSPYAWNYIGVGIYPKLEEKQ